MRYRTRVQEARRICPLASPALAVDVVTVKPPLMNPTEGPSLFDHSTDPKVPNVRTAAAKNTRLTLKSFIEASLIVRRPRSSRPASGVVAWANLRWVVVLGHCPMGHCPKVHLPQADGCRRAARFVQRHRTDLYPTTPMLVAAVEVRRVEQSMLSEQDVVAGVRFDEVALREQLTARMLWSI